MRIDLWPNHCKKRPLVALISSIFALSMGNVIQAEFIIINNNEHIVLENLWDLGAPSTIGVGINSDGFLTIDAGGTLISQLLRIGGTGGNGEVNIINGGLIRITNSVYSYPFAIGGNGDSGSDSAGIVGRLNITGAGSIMITEAGNGGEYSVGSNGAEGYVNISEGGKLVLDADHLYVGSHGDSTTKGEIVIDGAGSELSVTGRILVGAFNNGRIIVSNGALLSTDKHLYLGYSESENLVTVTGLNSTIYAHDYVLIGINTDASFVVADRSTLRTAEVRLADKSSATGKLIIGAQSGDSAVVAGKIEANSIRFYSGTGVITLNHTDADYLLSPNITGRGTMNVENGTTWLTGQNAGFLGQINLTGGTLGAGNNMALGGTTVLANDNGTLAYADGITLSNLITINTNAHLNAFVDTYQSAAHSGLITSGSDGLLEKVGKGTLILTADNETTFDGSVIISEGTLSVEKMGNLNNVMSTITIVNDGVLALTQLAANASDTLIEHTLLGNGRMTVDLGEIDKKLSLDPSKNSGSFTGSLALNQGIIDIDSSTETALRQATLTLGAQGLGVVSAGSNRTLGGLTLEAGRILFEDSFNIPGAKEGWIENYLTVTDVLDLSAGGDVQISGMDLDFGSPVDISLASGNAALIDQQLLVDGTGTKFVEIGLIQAGSIIGDGSNVTILDQNGVSLVSGQLQTLEIVQEGDVKAKGIYDFHTSNDANKLFIGYGLKELQLQTDGVDALTLSTAGTTHKIFGAKITGGGDLIIEAGNGAESLTLSNSSNSYNGATSVASGTLILGANHALGQTKALNLMNNAILDLNAKAQTIGTLITDVNSTLNFNAGVLAIANGGTVNGLLMGSAGQLLIQGQTPVTITNHNADLYIQTEIEQGAELVLQTANALGSGDINAEGTLRLENTTGMFKNLLTGQSGAVQLSDSTIDLRGNNNAFAGEILIDSTSHLTAKNPYNLGQSHINNEGQLTLDVSSDARWDLINSVSGTGALIKQGAGVLVVDSVQTYTGKTILNEGTLLVQSQSTSHGSLASSAVEINAGGTLGGYGSLAGQVINRGTILVGSAINNSLNFGALTIKGNYHGENGMVILGTVLANDASATDRLIIEGDATGQSNVTVNNIQGMGEVTDKGIEVIEINGHSEAQFNLLGRAVAGAYEYSLIKDADGNWYLRSALIDNGNGNNNRSLYRPEVGSYLANIAAANMLFSHQLSDRTRPSIDRDGRYTWVHMVGNHGKFNDSSGQLRTSTNNQALQIGGDILTRSLANNGVFTLGGMFGYGHTKSRTRGFKANAHSRSSGDGYALGTYGTWFKNNSELTGTYVDTWLQYVYFEHDVKGDFLQNERYKAKGLIASIEAGHTFPLSNDLYLQPQAQAIWLNVKADNHREYNHTRVRSGGQGNIQIRVGTRLFGEFDLSNEINLQPYSELNWVHNRRSYYVDMDGTHVNQEGAKNIGQLRVGLKAKMTQKLGVWSDLSHDIGKNHYRNTEISIGFKYQF